MVKHCLVFFGGLNHRVRYNDVWIYDTKQQVWTELKVSAKDTAEDVPPPRAHHGATLVDDRLFVFGGYGGHGKAYDDMYILDFGTALDGEVDEIVPPTWSKPALTGTGPSPRFDHGMTCFPGRLKILGGRDNIMMHSDVHHLDLETMTWMEEGKDQPKPYATEIANHQLMAIESVPNYKVFCLTGKKGQNDYLNHVDVMDCGSMVWTTPGVLGEAPPAREDTAIAYDPKTCKILLFGGWSNRWLGDMWTLNVAPIIGPPYAVFNVTPDIGMVFGGTEVFINGIQFKASGRSRCALSRARTTSMWTASS